MVAYACLRHAGWATAQIFCKPYMDTDLELSTSSIGLITGVGQFLAVAASLLTPRVAARYSNAWILVASPMTIAIGLLPVIDSRWHSLAYGALALGMGMGFGSASLLGGYVVEASGYPAVFLLGAIISTISGGLMWATLKSQWITIEGHDRSPAHESCAQE
jgi:hypothetical protein